MMKEELLEAGMRKSRNAGLYIFLARLIFSYNFGHMINVLQIYMICLQILLKLFAIGRLCSYNFAHFSENIHLSLI